MSFGLGKFKKIFVGLLSLYFLLPILPQAASAGWEIQMVEAVARNVGANTSIALDSNDNPHIFYMDYADSGLKYAKRIGTKWDIKTIPDSVDKHGAIPVIAIDSSDSPHIFYHATGLESKHAKWTGTKWSIETLNFVGYHCTPSVVLDALDNPHMSYYPSNDPSLNGALKYAKWNGSFWETETVDPESSPGYSSSIALDSLGNPHISYRDVTNEDLKYAKWNGSKWNIQTVDSNGVVGLHNSIALDSSDNPHISYWDCTTNGGLKYARWIPENLSYIKGYVKDSEGVGINNVTVNLSNGAIKTTATTSNGFYQFRGLPRNKSYAITARKTNYTFNPASINIISLSSNLDNQDFTATCTLFPSEDNIFASLVELLKDNIKEGENKYLDYSLTNEGEERFVIITSGQLNFDRIKRKLAMRGGQFGSVSSTDIVIYPFRSVDSGYEIALDKSDEVINNLSIKYLAQQKPVLPYNIDELTISNYKDTWLSGMRNKIEYWQKEPDKKALYRQIFREILSVPTVSQKEMASSAQIIIDTINEATKEYPLHEGFTNITSLPKEAIIKEIMLKSKGAMTLSETEAFINGLYAIPTSMKWIEIVTKGWVYIFTPVVAIEERCQNLERFIPYLKGACKISAQEILKEIRYEIRIYKNKALEWWNKEVKKELITDVTPKIIELISHKCKVWKVPAIGDIFIGVFMAWKGVEVLTNTDEILDEMYLAGTAAEIQDRANEEWMRLRRKIENKDFPSSDTINDIKAVCEVYLLAGAVGYNHLSRAFNAQDKRLLKRFWKEPDNLTFQYRNLTQEIRDVLSDWQQPAIVKSVCRNLEGYIPADKGTVSLESVAAGEWRIIDADLEIVGTGGGKYLMWPRKQDSAGCWFGQTVTYNVANHGVHHMVYKGYDDWRLPTYSELDQRDKHHKIAREYGNKRYWWQGRDKPDIFWHGRYREPGVARFNVRAVRNGP